MKVKLFPQTQKEQEQFLQLSSQDFKESLIKAFDMNEEAAEKDAKQTFKKVFEPKEGITHTFLSIFDKKQNTNVGGLWFTLNSKKSKAYLYQIIIYEQYRGQGYGKLSMPLLHNYCKEKGMKKITLSVFGFNKAAYRLYKGTGYDVLQSVMEKTL